jgi:signal transduction histidine kinase
VEGAAQQEPRRLADFLRERSEEILAHWEHEVMKVRSARQLSRPVLLDHLPDFISELAEYADGLRHGSHGIAPDESPRIHALERLEVGYDLAEVVEEYAVLRRCITELAFSEHTPALRSGELPRLHEAIDQAISTSVTRYTEARERTLRALDRISSAALVHHDVESLLPGTLDAFLATTAAVDTVALSLREDGSLRVRAAFGYPPPGPVGLLIEAEHFSARVEAKRAPLFLTDACNDPEIGSSPTCAPGTRALYGVPLILGDDVLGVAVMGSRSAYEFSQEDQFLFRTMVNRAATLIAQARLDQQLHLHAQELREALDYRDRMLGVLSHDLRNPLSVITTSASLLQMGPLDDKQRRAVARVAANASRIDRMVHDLLDWTRSRLPRGLPMAPQDGDLRMVCQQVVENMQVLHPDRNILLISEGITRGSFDPERALQCVSNLVGNALRYSPPATPVTVSLRAAPEGVWLSVHNLGKPIAEAMLPRLFMAFERGVSDERGRSAGLGLGLYIVKQIVEAHRGRVEVTSSAVEGTTFRVLWPAVVHRPA